MSERFLIKKEIKRNVLTFQGFPEIRIGGKLLSVYSHVGKCGSSYPGPPLLLRPETPQPLPHPPRL